MWDFIMRRPTLQIDGGTMNIYARNLPGFGDDEVQGDPAGFEGAKTFMAPSAPDRPLQAQLRVGFAACFPTRSPNKYTEHWVLFPTFRSPRVSLDGAIKRPVNPLVLEAAEPEEVLPGGWRDEAGFLRAVKTFVAAHPGCRYIRHQREDSLDGVP